MSKPPGVSIVSNKFPRLSGDVRRAVSEVVEATTFEVASGAKLKIAQGPKSGKTYPRGKDRKHVASAPGEAPATDVGNLINSIQTSMEDDLTGSVDVYAEYAPHLEFGTARGLEPRPFLVPAAEEAWPGFIEAVAAAVRKGGGDA